MSGGCGQSFFVVVVAAEFEEMKLLERQRTVNGLIESEIQQVHALQLKTWTAKQWEERKDSIE